MSANMKSLKSCLLGLILCNTVLSNSEISLHPISHDQQNPYFQSSESSAQDSSTNGKGSMEELDTSDNDSTANSSDSSVDNSLRTTTPGLTSYSSGVSEENSSINISSSSTDINTATSSGITSSSSSALSSDDSTAIFSSTSGLESSSTSLISNSTPDSSSINSTASLTNTSPSYAVDASPTSAVDVCASNPCGHGKCLSGENLKYSCSCDEGWSGDNCTQDADECLMDSHNCSQTEVCNNTIGSFVCNCKFLYFRNQSSNVCEKVKVAKYEVRFNGNWNDNLNNTSSEEYKIKVAELEQQIRNGIEAHIVKVTNLRRGSIIADTILGTSTEPVAVADFNISFAGMELNDRELCLSELNNCDSRSTTCVGLAVLKRFVCECKSGYERIPGVSTHCAYKPVIETDPCQHVVCQNSGQCGKLDNGGYICKCPEKYQGNLCEIEVNSVSSKEYDDIMRILIAVGIGLGSLAFFSTLGLIIVCCSGRRQESSIVSDKDGRPYAADEVTIDSWMPSLPRPKIKPGIFRDEAIELNENGRKIGDKEKKNGADNPAFIPEADYDGHKAGRLAINGKNKDYVYF